MMSPHENPIVSPARSSGTPRAGSALHYALQLLPVTQRPLMRAAHEVWHAMASIPMSLSDPSVAEAKLRWWQQEWLRASQGDMQHPSMQALHRELQALGLPWPPAELWQPSIEGWIQLAHQNRWIDQASLDRHMLDTTGHNARLCAWWLGGRSPAAQATAERLGVGLRRAHLLSRLGQDARSGWLMVGIDRLQHHDVKAHQITRPGSTPPAGWSSLQQELVRSALEELQAAWREASSLPAQERQSLLPLLALARCAHALVHEISASGDSVLHRRVVLTPFRKAWLSWLTQWAARWGRIHL